LEPPSPDCHVGEVTSESHRQRLGGEELQQLVRHVWPGMGKVHDTVVVRVQGDVGIASGESTT
jgi:hypothetical protein